MSIDGAKINNLHAVRSFLSLANYYNRFVRGYSEITNHSAERTMCAGLVIIGVAVLPPCLPLAGDAGASGRDILLLFAGLMVVLLLLLTL